MLEDIIKKFKRKNWKHNAMNNAFTLTQKINNCSKGTLNMSLTHAKYVVDDSLSVYYENIKIKFSSSIIYFRNRYYFSILDFEGILFSKSKKYDYKTLSEKCLRNPPVLFKNTAYISMIDITEIFNLISIWNYEKNEIRLFNIREEFRQAAHRRLKEPALLRLEDITAGADYSRAEELEKLRVVGNFLYSQSIPFHIAWVARYKNPRTGIDNDLLKNVYNMYNADFIFTMDYLIVRGGIVGLHGYTHQFKSGVSIEDSEFGEGYYSTAEDAKVRVLQAINTAKELNIPYIFFESPHYSCTEAQQAVFENYFNYIFEPYQGVWNKVPIVSRRNKKTIYVPTPLGYVHDMDVEHMLKRIRKKPYKDLAALFYHPYKEFGSIKIIKSQKGYHLYNYETSSNLHKILECLTEERYSLIKITDIKF